MTSQKADKRTYAPSTQRRRYNYLLRPVRRTATDVARENRLLGRGTRGEDGRVHCDAVQLGECKPVAGERRPSTGGTSSQRERQESFAERINARHGATNIETCLYTIVACVLLQTILVFIHVIGVISLSWTLKTSMQTINESSATSAETTAIATFPFTELYLNSITDYDKTRTGIIDRYCVHDERIVLNCAEWVLRHSIGRRVSENTRKGYSSKKGTNTASDKCYFGRQATQKASPAIHNETSEISKEPIAKINSQRSLQFRAELIAWSFLRNSSSSSRSLKSFSDSSIFLCSIVSSTLFSERIVESWSSLRCYSLRSQALIPTLSTFPFTELYLNPVTDYADKKEYESPSPQSNRHVDVFRPVRGATADAAGKGENDRTGTVRIDWDSQKIALRLGIRAPGTVAQSLSNSCQSLENQDSDALSRRIKRKNLKIFPENHQFGYFASCNSPNWCYNDDINKNGEAKDRHLLLPLTANLRELDLLLTPNYTSLVYLTSGSSQQPVREKRAFSHNL